MLRTAPIALGGSPGWVLAALIVLGLGGCARYEYRLVEPPELARHLGKSPQTIQLDPLEYRMQSYDNRLVIQVYNPTDEPVELLGQASYAVAPDGESHPLRSRTIAPGAFIKLILPPREPTPYRGGPTFGVGVGMRVRAYDGPRHFYPYGSHWSGRHFLYHPYPPYHYGLAPGPWAYPGPYYLVDYGEVDPTYWEWRGQTPVRLLLMYGRRDSTFQHAFVFERQKV